VFNQHPYLTPKANKKKWLLSYLNELTKYHYKHSPQYKRILQTLFLFSESIDSKPFTELASLPYIPSQIFKELELKSVDNDQVRITLHSSGTTSKNTSRIFLDQETSELQKTALNKILLSLLGNTRYPMIIVDSLSLLKNRATFNARLAAILGFMRCGFDHLFLLDENMQIRTSELQQFLKRYETRKILIFGFTSLIWQYLYKSPFELNLQNGVLIHGGGWKKLQEQAVSNTKFKAQLRDRFNLTEIYNYYGFIEQTGSIFLECSEGVLHTPIFADIIVRDSVSLKPVPNKKIGLLQTLSVLARSYPGHSVLTEDLAVCEGEDDCRCGRLGKYFTILGRHAQAELRGCSDTYTN